VLKRLLPGYPDLNVEIVNDYGLTDIVSERFDAGVRLGEQVAKDMIAVRIAPDMPMALVGSPAYFADHPPLNDPQDLIRHRCINLRLPTSGSLRFWPFAKNGHELKVRTEGQLVFNAIDMIVEGTLADLGLSYQPQMIVQEHLDTGRLIRVLDDWSQSLPGYHLYYPSRRQPTPAFKLLVNALRYRG
jgi:DNA-binding transcriptional LysR family regulator